MRISYPPPPDPNCIKFSICWIENLMQFGGRVSFFGRLAGVAGAHPIKEE